MDVMADHTDPNSLLSRFGLKSFRSGQQEVIDAVASGADVMCVMPTGGGKSLCYQLPSLARAGTTIVVSPLIALMKDQVDTLKSLDIRAKLINSSLSTSQQNQVMSEMAAGELDLVYIAPERLRNGRFLEAVESANVTLLAVDEAHCVSEWGHDFRPDYSRLGQVRERYLHGVQTIALTATATPVVRDDIIALLNLKTPRTFVTGFARTNLRFSVTHAKTERQKEERLLNYLGAQKGAGIIYAATRKRCEEIGEWLPEKLGRSIGVYHAGLDQVGRHKVQEAFMSGKLSAIVATNAFGMGIDKSNIRFVVHYNMPGSLEAYYQEAGRAGRDGEMSDCELLFSYQDRYIQEFFIENRYPSRATVKRVHEYLLSREEDPIELTLDQVREGAGVKDGSEAVGTAETLLARAGVIRRLDSSAGQAMVRIDSKAPTLLDFLPKEAKVRRRVMLAIEKVVGRRRGEDVFVQPKRLMQMAEVNRDQLARTLRELRRLRSFDYVPPFRGRAVHFIDRERPFDQMDIDFDELDQRKKAEFQKLEAVITLANTSGCRQRVILNYFGEVDPENCGTCDRCQPSDGSEGRGSDVSLGKPLEGVDAESLIRGVRVVLSGVTRIHGRFGKTLIAQMLCGSKSKRLKQWRLNQLSTYSLLSGLKQNEVVAVMDALLAGGLLEMKEVEERRPTLHLTAAGRELMKSATQVPASVRMPLSLAKKLALAVAKLEAADVQTQSAGMDNGEVSSQATESQDAEALTSGAQTVEVSDPETQARVSDLKDTLTRWRGKSSAALGIPAYKILTNATIERLAAAAPTTLESFQAVSGIGSATVDQFGEDLVELIQRFLLHQEVPDEGAPVPEESSASLERPESGQPENRAASPSDAEDAYWTWRLFRDGYSPAQIAAIRKRKEADLVDDLVAASLAGHLVRVDWLAPSPDRQRLETALESSKGVG